MRTRYATVDDIPRILELMREGAEEVPYFHHIDDDIATASLMLFINDENYFCRAIVNEDDTVMGGIICQVTRTWFNDHMHGCGITIFIHRSHRGKGGALLLYKEFTEWSKGWERVSCISLQTTSGVNIEPIVGRLKYKVVGKTYRLDL